jgi:hypothetical protein
MSARQAARNACGVAVSSFDAPTDDCALTRPLDAVRTPEDCDA